MIERLQAGESPRQVAASLQISPRTVYKWQARWRAEGAAGLADRSSRPHRIPRRLPRPRRRAIEKLRKRGWSTPAIAEATGIPLSTVVDTVRRLGLSRLRLTPPVPSAPRSSAGSTAGPIRARRREPRRWLRF